jgi:hypothetical protein
MSESGTRYAVITADNQSANIWVCAIIAVAFSTACMAVRIINRSRFAFKFGIDDYTFAGAWVCHYLYEHLHRDLTFTGAISDTTRPAIEGFGAWLRQRPFHHRLKPYLLDTGRE